MEFPFEVGQKIVDEIEILGNDMCQKRSLDIWCIFKARIKVIGQTHWVLL